jgi:hypothetical protein
MKVRTAVYVRAACACSATRLEIIHLYTMCIDFSNGCCVAVSAIITCVKTLFNILIQQCSVLILPIQLWLAVG